MHAREILRSGKHLSGKQLYSVASCLNMLLLDTLPAVALFGENLKRIRLERGLTQEKVAEGMGYERTSSITVMETKFKARLPKPETIERLAVALGCAPVDLLDGVAIPKNPYEKLLQRQEARLVEESAAGEMFPATPTEKNAPRGRPKNKQVPNPNRRRSAS